MTMSCTASAATVGPGQWSQNSTQRGEDEALIVSVVHKTQGSIISFHSLTKLRKQSSQKSHTVRESQVQVEFYSCTTRKLYSCTRTGIIHERDMSMPRERELKSHLGRTEGRDEQREQRVSVHRCTCNQCSWTRRLEHSTDEMKKAATITRKTSGHATSQR